MLPSENWRTLTTRDSWRIGWRSAERSCSSLAAKLLWISALGSRNLLSNCMFVMRSWPSNAFATVFGGRAGFALLKKSGLLVRTFGELARSSVFRPPGKLLAPPRVRPTFLFDRPGSITPVPMRTATATAPARSATPRSQQRSLEQLAGPPLRALCTYLDIVLIRF